MEGAEGYGVGYLVGALLAVPADVGGFDADGVTAEGAIEAAHGALVGVGAQDLLGEAPEAGAETGGLGRSPAGGEIEGDVEVDGGADQFGEDRGEVQVQEQAGGGRQSLRVGQEMFYGCAQTAYRSAASRASSSSRVRRSPSVAR